MAAALVANGCAGRAGTAEASAAIAAEATPTAAPPAERAADPGTTTTLAASRPTLPATVPPPPATAAPAPAPALAWYTLDHHVYITWSTYEVRDRAGRVVEHVALSRHLDLTNSDWRIVVTTRPADAATPVPRDAVPMRLGDRDAWVALADGRLDAVWSAPDAVVSVSVDAPRATEAELLDMAAHVRALSNEQAYWLAPVVSVPGSERVLFDADDAKRFASRVRSELLEAGLRVGEPEPSPDGLFYWGTTRDGAEMQLWVGPGVGSSGAYGTQWIVGERTITSRMMSGGWRFELLLVAPERAWNADTARSLVVRLGQLAPPLRLGRKA